MINYNNNYQNSTFQQTQQSEPKPLQQRLPLNQLQFQQLIQHFNQPQKIQEIEPIQQEHRPDRIDPKLQKFQDIDHIQCFEPSYINKIAQNEEKNIEKYVIDDTKKREEGQQHRQIKQQKGVDEMNDRTQRITASHCSQQNLSNSNLSSLSESIHSNIRGWRQENNKQQEQLKNHSQDGKKLGKSIEKKLQLNKKSQNNWVKSSYKYLFYAPQIIEEKVKGGNKKDKNGKSKQKQIILVKAQQENRLEYDYIKGKKKEGESTKDRMKSKFGVILNTFEDTSQVVSVSYYSQNASELYSSHNISVRDLKKKTQEKLEIYPQRKAKETVIFVGQPQQQQQQQINHFKIEEVERIKHRHSSKNLVDLQQKQTFTEHKQSKAQNITPKQTINLDKSFKSHSPKSQSFAKSLDQSKSNKATKKTPNQKRRNSFQEIEQIITEIQQKQHKLKKMISQSIKSNKNEIQNKDEQQIFTNLKKKKSTKSLLYKSNRYELSDQEKQLIEPKRYAEKSSSKRSENNINASSEQVKVKQAQLKMTPTSTKFIKNQNSKEHFFSSSDKNRSQPFQDIDHIQNSNVVQKQQQFEQLENLTNQKVAQNNSNKIAPFFKSKGLDNQFIDEQMVGKQKKKIKQLKEPVKKLKNTYLKTVEKYQIDEGELISEFLPKNKVQFKIDSNRKLKTQLSDKPLQNKKILALLKRREEALAKKVRQMNQINPKTFLFPESSSGTGVSKQSSLNSNEINSNFKNISSLGSKKQEKNDQKMMVQNEGVMRRRETANIERSFFPTLIIRPHLEKIASNSFYVQNQSSKVRMIRENRINTQRKREKERSNNSSDKQVQYYESNKIQRSIDSGKVTNKVQFSNLNRMRKQHKASSKNTSAKQKYQRLKLLLGQN